MPHPVQLTLLKKKPVKQVQMILPKYWLHCCSHRPSSGLEVQVMEAEQEVQVQEVQVQEQVLGKEHENDELQKAENEEVQVQVQEAEHEVGRAGLCAEEGAGEDAGAAVAHHCSCKMAM